MSVPPELPLSGIRILDLTVIFAGPAATMLMADWGAEVIRLESFAHYPVHTRGPQVPEPSFTKRMRDTRHPYYAYVDGEPGERPWNRYGPFNTHGRNKLSVELDPATPEGRDQFLALARTADVVIENNGPRLLDRLKLTFEDLQVVNPRISVVRMPGFGLDGPYRDYKANGLNMDAISGHLWSRGYPDAGPEGQGQVVTADAVAAVCGALGATLALIHRRRTGVGQLVEAAMVEGFLSCLPAGILEHALTGNDPGPRGNRGTRFAPQDVYPCQGEDEWITLAVRTTAEWQGLCLAMDFHDWLDSGDYDAVADRMSDRDLIGARISRWTMGKSAADVTSALEHIAAVAPVMSESDIFADPHVSARGLFGPLTQADSGTHLYMKSWWLANGERAPLRLPPPLMGEHSIDSLLADRPVPVDPSQDGE